MRTLDQFIAGAMALITLYLVLNMKNTGDVIDGFASGSTNIIKALQGR